VHILVLNRGQESGIEDFLFNLGVNGECIADVGRERLFLRVRTSLFKLLEPILHLLMIGFQQCHRIGRGLVY